MNTSATPIQLLFTLESYDFHPWPSISMNAQKERPTLSPLMSKLLHKHAMMTGK
jgi:hypothetical protein